MYKAAKICCCKEETRRTTLYNASVDDTATALFLQNLYLFFVEKNNEYRTSPLFISAPIKKYVILSVCEESHYLPKLILKIIFMAQRDSSGDKHPQNDFYFINYFISEQKGGQRPPFCFTYYVYRISACYIPA